jgi:pyruvate formate lyase activating enzyme
VQGLIFNIQKYSIHDGPGIRTTVFLKGCPLSCSWCHNPESQCFEKELLLFTNRCISCEDCVKACSTGALKSNMGIINRDSELCIMCSSCAQLCCTNALEVAGREVSVLELVKELEKDTIFYDSSKGGITVSGGEPLSQGEFTLELLKRCKQLELHTTVDTSGFGSTAILEEISKYTDLFLFDIKLVDKERHQQHTGVSNEIILQNLELLSKLGKRIWIRLPVIPGINDDEENISATAKLIQATAGVEQINLLPYHNAAMEKYKRLNKEYQLNDIKMPQKEYMDKIAGFYRLQGINVLIGG